MNNSIYIYVFVFAITLLIMGLNNVLVESKSLYRRILSSILISLPLAILASLRMGVGTDFFNYEYVYKSAVDYFQAGLHSEVFKTTEPLYVVIEWLAFILSGKNYNVFLFIISMLTLIPVNMFIMQQVPKKQRILSLSIYMLIYFLTSFNIIRQMLAVSVVVFGFKYLINRNFKNYFITIVVATLVHNSAIIAIALYFLDVDISLKSKITIKQLIAIVGIFLVPVGYILVLTIGPNLPLIGQYFQNYSNVQNESNIYFIALTLLPIVPALFFKGTLKNTKGGLIVYNMLLFSIVVAFLGFINEWAFRLLYYPSIMVMYAYPMIIEELKSGQRIIMKAFIICYVIVVSYLTYVTFGFNNVLPYESVPFDTLFIKL